MEQKTFYIKTFGCQMNEHDSQKITGLLQNLGYKETEGPEGADLILFNTCTVRQKAHHKAFSEIGRAIQLKKTNISTPAHQHISTLIGVCGCVAQEEGSRLLNRFPEIDIIFGPDQIYKLPTLLDLVQTTGKPAIATELVNSAEDYHFLDAVPAIRLKGPTAYVTIMKGCNSHCSYCIVPSVRGTEVYRPAREIVREIQALVEKGCLEVTLLGQNVNSYGSGESDEVSFAKLIRIISENTDIRRIRFISPHPKDVKEDLVREFADNPKLCSHIHLPLQSGSDSVLRRMRRAYNRRTYSAKVEQLRKARPDIAVTTDMIVGFPQESDSEFNQTIEFIKDIQFDNLFGFKYSPRPGTQAFAQKDDVPEGVKEERLAKLLALQNEISKGINQRYVGSLQEVLVEGPDRMATGRWMGKTPSNKITNFTGKEGLIGAIVKVEVMKANPNSLEGKLCDVR